MKRYIRPTATSANANAKKIAQETFGTRYRDEWRVKVYRQSAGYAVKYYADSPEEAENVLDQMTQTAEYFDIPVIKAYTTEGFLQQFGSVHYYVACIVVPAADIEASADYGYDE